MSSHHTILEHFITPQINPYHLYSLTHSIFILFLLWLQATTDLLSVSTDLLALDISYNWKHAICGILCPTYLYIFFGGMPIKSFVQFSIALFFVVVVVVVLLLTHKCSLYTLDISPLSHIYHLQIFSPFQ